LFRDKITDMVGGYTGKLCLAELITKLLEFERNVYWHMDGGCSAAIGGKVLKVVRPRD